MGTSKSGLISNSISSGQQGNEKGTLWAVAGSFNRVERTGQTLSPINLNQQVKIPKAHKEDIIDIEIQANICNSQKNILNKERAIQHKKKVVTIISLDQFEEPIMANQPMQKGEGDLAAVLIKD
ncbi:hypothetical protein H5410_030925 [Solanum commersonii]|uniref:Uncharacterized protein n=1 Tax=Solanum commersonii TaxID=4109 RepID=A0A9J5YFN7_SOLCO|nr:hypothetical protein H5410_030925 [Solanum commersonii]